MILITVENDCEVERIRGGCFPCRVSRFATYAVLASNLPTHLPEWQGQCLA